MSIKQKAKASVNATLSPTTNITTGSNFSTSTFSVIRDIISRLRKIGKVRTAEIHQASLNSFIRFRNKEDLSFEMFTKELIEEYESYLVERNLSKNTIGFYMRVLKTDYNIAIKKGYTLDLSPFENVYTGVDKTIKRALKIEEIKRIKDLDLPVSSSLDFARDMFLLSFYTRGMSFVDMAYALKKNLCNDVLCYRRRKTGQPLSLEWNGLIVDIMSKYKNNQNQYLFPIITKVGVDDRKQYNNQMHKVNRLLKQVAKLCNLGVPLSMYYARHSWASIAHRMNIPLAIISEGLGHDSERTTQIYLDSLHSTVIEDAHMEILKNLL